jgi:hypothetical protein
LVYNDLQPDSKLKTGSFYLKSWPSGQTTLSIASFWLAIQKMEKAGEMPLLLPLLPL